MNRRAMVGQAVVCATLVCAAAPAHAAEPSPLVERAEEAEEEGRYEDALRAWEGAYREDGDIVYVYRRIQLYRKMERPGEALSLLREFRDELAAHEAITGVLRLEQQLEKEQAELAAREQAERERRLAEGGGGKGEGGGEEPARSSVVWPWVVGSAGVLTVFGSVAMFLASSNQALRARCSPDVSSDKTGCGDVEDPYVFVDDASYDRTQRRIRTYHVMGWVFGGVGLAALGVATWGLVRGSGGAEPEPTSGAQVRWEVTPLRGGGYVGMRWRF